MSSPTPSQPKKPSLIRWERVGPALIALAVVTLLVIFLLDPFIKWVLIKTGQGVFGARVNIEKVKSEFRRGRISIRGLQVADKSAPMQNLFQWDNAAFDFRTLPLLEKKVFIDEASLDGLKFGAPRRTSGALPFEEKKPGFVGKAADKLWSRVEKVSLDKFAEVKKDYDPKTLLDPNQLQTYKTANEAKERLQKAPETLQGQINQLNAKQRAADLQKRVQTLKQSGGTGPEAILQKASEVKALQAEIQSFKNDLANTQRAVTDQIQSAQNLVDDVKKAREDDWKAIRSKLSLPSLDKASMASALFGPTIAQWGERTLSTVHTVRQSMPPKPKSPPPPPRGRSRIIEFPRTNALPRFTLALARLSGQVGQEKPFGFTGTLTGITTNPPLYGKPATIALQGAQGARSFNVKGTLDHTQDIPMEALQATYNGFSLSSLNFGQEGSLAFGLKQGEGRASVDLTIRGDALSGRADLQGSNLSVEPKVDLKSNSPIAQRASKNITASLAAVKAMNVGIGISGTLESPDLSIDSNIGSVVADALKNALGAEVAEQEKALRAQFEQQTAGKIQELQGSVEGLKQKYLPQLASDNKLIEDLLAQLKSSSAGAAGKPLESLKNIFGR
jgi:uncharacterized protein (TIGR03545 family)